MTATDGGFDEFKALLARQEARIRELEGLVTDARSDQGECGQSFG